MLNKTYLVIVLLLFFSSCIERYIPDELKNIESRIVIDGLISNQTLDGLQRIYISQSVSIDTLVFLPLSECDVYIKDSDDHKIEFAEQDDNQGCYLGFIPDSLFRNNNEFILEVITSTGRVYESAIEEITPIPPIDCVYYEVNVIPTTDPYVSYWGAQFYIDFKADDRYGNYYRFELEESYEYHSHWPIQLYMNEDHQMIDGPEDFSYFYCYKTDKLKELFTLSTEGFSNNSYIKFPLHVVSNQTQRLVHNYSFLLTQYSLSKTAYAFWNSIRENSQESDNMFGKQPSPVHGNIKCLTNPDETVLGYFGVSAVRQKRITYLGGIDMSFDYVQCEPMITDWLPTYRPLYLIYVEENGEKLLAVQITECVICTEKGGVTEKPWFFEE